MDNTSKQRQWIPYTIIIISVILMIVVQFVSIQYSRSELDSSMIKNILIRLLGGMIFLVILVDTKYNVLGIIQKPYKRTLLVVFVAAVISIYNFPFIAYARGTAIVTSSSSSIWLFALECLSIGFFEEILFRGLILVWLLKKLSQTKKGVFQAIVVSSLLFSMLHVLNIFSGMSVIDVLLQLGYTFLMGMMWALVLIKTKSLWVTIILHAIYNFCGLVFFTLGTITGNADVITIITTTILAFIVAFIMIKTLFDLDHKEVHRLYQKN